jgi:sugar phosphate isomerase/epimerase
MRAGLVSITFRKLSVPEIIDAAVKARLEGIEWGGDVHVPHGDLDAAREAARQTADAGLAVAAYGSYYRAAESEGEGLPFAAVLHSAQALGAPTVRVWAGRRGSADADAAYRAAVVADLVHIGATARAAGITVACEYHGGTLTDTNASARALAEEVAHAGVRLYWQPPNGQPFAYCRDGLQAVLPHVTNLHVFHWVEQDGKLLWRPLDEGKEVWPTYLEMAAGDRWALLEFVADGAVEQLLRDAAALRGWIAET